jgi:hypothetical protein
MLKITAMTMSTKNTAAGARNDAYGRSKYKAADPQRVNSPTMSQEMPVPSIRKDFNHKLSSATMTLPNSLQNSGLTVTEPVERAALT